MLLNSLTLTKKHVQLIIYLPQSKVLPPSIFMGQLLPVTQLRSKPANWGTKLGWVCSQEQKGSNCEIFFPGLSS